MYDRNYAGNTLSFEPSGGLMNASLVMQDKQTDTYWSIMSGKAEAGSLAGTDLVELPFGEKMQWREWVAKHPDTLVLSVTRTDREGRQVTLQDPGRNAYEGYFAGAEGYRGLEATDTRLATKSHIHAFVHDGKPYAVDLRRVIGGKAFELHDGRHLFVFREASDDLIRGSAAFVSTAGFEQRSGSWVELATGASFNALDRNFGDGVARLNGFDTFWYTWSLMHADTELLR